jgi:hypothetical protein
MVKIVELKNTIEKMSKYHQIEILRILSSDDDVCVNENKNGTFINLTDQKPDMIEKMEAYCTYVEEQQKSLEYQEKEKIRLLNTYFKEDKDITSH